MVASFAPALHGPRGETHLMFWKRVRLTLEMIKFEHSVFALPFALTGALLALREGGLRTRGRCGGKLLWIVVAMVGARSAAMAFNRVLDADIDAPQSAHPHAPSSRRAAFRAASPGASWRVSAWFSVRRAAS